MILKTTKNLLWMMVLVLFFSACNEAVKKLQTKQPGAPTGLSAKFNGDSNSITLDWTAGEKSVRYHVYWSSPIHNSGQKAKIENASQPYNFLITDTTRSPVYYFTVTGTNISGEGNSSAELTVVVPPVLDGRAGNGKNVLIWEPWPVIADLQINYSLYSKAGATPEKNTSDGFVNLTPPYTHESLVNDNLSYFYILTAKIGNVESDPSNAVILKPSSAANSRPVLQPPFSFSVNENALPVGKILASDPEGQGLIYSISGGPDRDLFVINANNGELSLKNSLDWEKPIDSDGDNVYNIVVKVSDFLLSDEKIVAISVKDVADAPTVPNLKVSGSLKQLHFSWDAVPADSIKLYVNDGSGLWKVSNPLPIATNATEYKLDISVHQIDWLKTRYYLEICRNTGNPQCAGSSANAVAIKDLMLNTIGYFKASNLGTDDEFGRSVALSADGSTLAVGAPYVNSSNLTNKAGQAYVFKRAIDGAWTEEANIKASNPGADDQFGWSLALSADGNTLAVGAIGEDNIDNLTSDAGAVYVFKRSTDGIGVWTEKAYLKASNSGVLDQFGWTVALSADGSTLAIGTPYEDNIDNLTRDAGAAYVFKKAMDSTETWSEKAYLKASNLGVDDRFGSSVALSADGNTLAVGAFLEDNIDNLTRDAGAIYVFKKAMDGTETWSEKAYLKASNLGVDDQFGTAVALSSDGGTLAVGAPFEDSTNNLATNAGAAYIFKRATDGTETWSEKAYLKASNPRAGDGFGTVVTLSADGSILAVGAPYKDNIDNLTSTAGAIYVFKQATDGTWNEKAYPKASNPGANDQFGTAVALSADGSTLAVGSPYEDGANGLGSGLVGQANDSALDSGAVYLY